LKVKADYWVWTTTRPRQHQAFYPKTSAGVMTAGTSGLFADEVDR